LIGNSLYFQRKYLEESYGQSKTAISNTNMDEEKISSIWRQFIADEAAGKAPETLPPLSRNAGMVVRERKPREENSIKLGNPPILPPPKLAAKWGKVRKGPKATKEFCRSQNTIGVLRHLNHGGDLSASEARAAHQRLSCYGLTAT
jgi:hypothetical protein